MERSTLRKLLLFSLLSLVVITFAGAYLVHDVRLLLLLVPPSLTYFLLDSVKDARHQKELANALDAKRAARREEQDKASAKAEAKGSASARKTPRRTKAA